MRLSRYLARRFALAFLLVFGIFLGLMLLIDLVEQVRRFSDRDVSLGSLLGLAALNVPDSLYAILPLIMLLAAISLFLALARSSELVAIRAAGRSGIRLLLSPVTVALAIGAFTVMVLNPFVAATTKRAEELAARYANGVASVLSVNSEGLWLRQGGDGMQTVIHANRANEDGTELSQVTFLNFDAEGRPLGRIEAAEARLGAGAWALSDVKQWRLDVPNPEAEAERLPSVEVASDLTAARIRDSFGEPSTVALWELPQFIAELDQAGFSSLRHRVWFQMELATPVLFAGMVLLAAGFTMRHARFGGTGVMVLAAVLAGFGIFFLRNFAQVLGESGQIPISIAAWSAPVATILLALGLLLHVEDG